MANQFYFYDLETTGFRASTDRIVQFAGQRVDLDFKPIAEPDNFLIKLSPDILPHPKALLVSGISPQQTLSEGLSEAEFLRYFHETIATPETIFVGFNNIGFDDDFIRYLNYRNFYDPYTWQWQTGKSKWDIYQVAVMTRALRPDGINWPVAEDGSAVNKLEELAKSNKLNHSKAHDALSDVQATIDLAALLKSKQPKLFNYLFENRSKSAVNKLISGNKPFVYSAGPFSSEFSKTSVVANLGPALNQSDQFIYFDLRINPQEYIDLDVAKLKELYLDRYNKDKPKLPFGLIKTNKCPAVAPISVLSQEDQQRLSLDLGELNKNLHILNQAGDFADKLTEALSQAEEQSQASYASPKSVDERLYDGFFNEADQIKMATVRAASPEQLADLHLDFADSRLSELLPLYKARNYPESLSQDENTWWQNYLKEKLIGAGDKSAASQFFAELHEAAQEYQNDADKSFLLTEIQLYVESILPLD